MDPLERVIRPIVEGQIRGFLKEHPALIEAVDWYKPRKDKAVTFTNSLAKRIIRDLTCATSRARLAAALLEASAEARLSSTVETCACGEGGRLGMITESAVAKNLPTFAPLSGGRGEMTLRIDTLPKFLACLAIAFALGFVAGVHAVRSADAIPEIKSPAAVSDDRA